MISMQIYELLDDLKKNKSITVLIVSHDVDRALKYADNVIELENGEIVFLGSPSEYKVRGEQ